MTTLSRISSAATDVRSSASVDKPLSSRPSAIPPNWSSRPVSASRLAERILVATGYWTSAVEAAISSRSSRKRSTVADCWAGSAT